MAMDNKKKMSIIGVCCVLVVVAVVVAAVVCTKKHDKAEADKGDVQQSNKAIQALCDYTDYKDTCFKSLAGAKNTDDPKELIKIGFNVAVLRLDEAIKNSTTIHRAENDPRTTTAIKTCKELLNNSIDDLRRSFDKVGDFDISKMDDYISLLKVWLSGSITYQQTCIDAFQNTTGDASDKMKQLLTTAGQITSNGLAMVTQLSNILVEIQISNGNRRLFTAERFNRKRGVAIPAWVDPVRRSVLSANINTLKPTVTVAQDGSGQCKTIQEAVNRVPNKNTQLFVILIKAGVYREYVDIPRGSNNVILIGEGTDKTKITGNKNFADGVGTYKTATVAANGDGFAAKGITFENSAGAVKHQAVALRVSADMSIIYNCRIDAYQDTLYAHTYRQFYRDTIISGTIDFIFGDSSSIFQNCQMIVRKPDPNQNNMVTAQGRTDPRGVGGLVLQNCTITSEPGLLTTPGVKSYLGRPWKEYSRTIYLQSEIGGFIDPEGWSVWNGNFGLDTSYYAEYMNRGPGSNTNRRVAWKSIQKLSPQQAEQFTGGVFYQDDAWIKTSGVPYEPGMMRV